MGKNQGYKAMQRARVGSSSAGPDEIEDGMVDGSYHTPEWHAARLASLKTTHTITWEEYKQKQKEEELKKGELEADTDKLMREYRAQLDAERAMKLSKGRNYPSEKSRKDKKERDYTDRKDRDSKKKKSKKRKVQQLHRVYIREGDRLTQAHPPNHQVATKRNLGVQGQVLKDPKGRRNTSLEADTQAKVKMRLTVLCRCRNSLAVFKS
ncbi:unnamed protein product [Thlaspi arvense]|uniref:Uncharacterized protein n=1 Tax=Thlaspi arvense TaxID=13288 RepID=A0AAU9S628_THLAR|nr:unnamed protein product [Thlaspi arvense]